jgi:hypothetical protein
MPMDISKSSQQYEILCKWALSLIEASEFVDRLRTDPAMKELLGVTTYNDVLSYDYGNESEVVAVKKRINEYLSNNSNELFAKYKAKFVLDRMLTKNTDLLAGVRELVYLSHKYKFIPIIFVGIDSEAESYGFSRLNKDQEEQFRELILREAKQLKTTLAENGI